MFQTAKPTKVFQDVVAQIEDAILAGRIGPGQILPSERELKEMLQVSRGTLREALRVLEQKGLIEIRLGVGGGSVVRSVGIGQVSESLALLIRSQKVSLHHLAEFREAVEGNVAAQAAERCSPADVAKLDELLAQGRACIEARDGRRDQLLAIDRQIHMVLAQITGNPLYISILTSVHENIHRYYERFLSMEGRELAENFRDLCAIVRAVARRDKDKARSLSQNHVMRFNRYMAGRAKREQKAAAPARKIRAQATVADPKKA